MIPVMGPTKPKKRDYVGDYYSGLGEDEEGREKRVHDLLMKRVMDNLRRALRIEVTHGKPLSGDQRDKLIMDPLEFISKSYVKISLADLYRRYRQIRIQALTECIAIVGNGTTQQGNMDAIREKIVDIGEAHKASKSRYKKEEEEINKCAEF